MRLKTKIFISIIPIVGCAFLLTGWLVLNHATNAAHDTIYQYSEGILQAYISQDLESRVSILRDNDLDRVPSFVESYQKEALSAAGKLNLIWPGHLFVVDAQGRVIYCSSGEMSGQLPEKWSEIVTRLQKGQGLTLKEHIPGDSHESFVGRYFSPWKWAVFITIKGDLLYERERLIWLTTVLVGIVASLGIIFSLGYLLHRVVLSPVAHLRDATEDIAMNEQPVSIPVSDGDEFGELSRDIEGMSYRIHQSRQELQAAYDELMVLDEMKTALITNVSHELRTPLTSVVGFAKLGLRKITCCKAELKAPECIGMDCKDRLASREALEVIISEGEHMQRMVDGIVDLMSLMSRDVVARMHPLDLGVVVRRVGEGVRESAESKGLDLHLDIRTGPIPVKADSGMIELVLEHYLINAITFTNEGEVRVQVDAQGAEAVVEVRDTGVGINTADVEKIFDQFYQAGDIMTEKPRGLGIGLSICREIITLHGGRTWAVSELGKGSRFYFALPLGEWGGAE